MCNQESSMGVPTSCHVSKMSSPVANLKRTLNGQTNYWFSHDLTIYGLYRIHWLGRRTFMLGVHYTTRLSHTFASITRKARTRTLPLAEFAKYFHKFTFAFFCYPLRDIVDHGNSVFESARLLLCCTVQDNERQTF